MRLPVLDARSGYGAEGHPSVPTHQLMAGQPVPESRRVR